MMEPITKGILSGLAYGLLIGPLFFLNIRTTLRDGRKQGFMLVAGAFLSDLSLVIASWWSAEKLSKIANEEIFKSWFGLICGLLLFIFGLTAAWPRERRFPGQTGQLKPPTKSHHTFLQGFSINMSNPSNWLFWLGVATAARAEASGTGDHYVRLFMISALITLFMTDLSKALLAHQIGKWLKPGVPELIVRIAGFILMGVSVWILIGVARHFL